MRYLSILSLFIILLAGCATVVSTGYEVTVSKISEIDISDGVDKEEAIFLAKNYLIESGNDQNCHLDNPSIRSNELDNHSSWIVAFRTVLKKRLKQGFFWYDIYVDKNTGQIKTVY